MLCRSRLNLNIVHSTEFFVGLGVLTAAAAIASICLSSGFEESPALLAKSVTAISAARRFSSARMASRRRASSLSDPAAAASSILDLKSCDQGLKDLGLLILEYYTSFTVQLLMTTRKSLNLFFTSCSWWSNHANCCEYEQSMICTSMYESGDAYIRVSL